MPDDIEKQLLDLAHRAFQAAGEQLEGDLRSAYGRFAPELEVKVRKFTNQDDRSVKGVAWIGVPKGAGRDQAILGSLRTSRRTDQYVTPKKAKVLKFDAGGETLYRPRARWPERINPDRFESVVGTFAARLQAEFNRVTS